MSLGEALGWGFVALSIYLLFVLLVWILMKLCFPKMISLRRTALSFGIGFFVMALFWAYVLTVYPGMGP